MSKPAINPAAAVPALSPRNLSSLPHRNYRFRVLGMGLASLPQFAVYSELQSHWSSWAWTLVCCVLWPHIAYLVARRSKDPLRAELRNFVIDSMMAGSWVPLMHFNLLPSVVLLTVTNADKINSGVRGLWLRSLPGMASALLIVGLATGHARNHADRGEIGLRPTQTFRSLRNRGSCWPRRIPTSRSRRTYCLRSPPTAIRSATRIPAWIELAQSRMSDQSA